MILSRLLRCLRIAAPLAALAAVAGSPLLGEPADAATAPADAAKTAAPAAKSGKKRVYIGMPAADRKSVV